MTDPKKKPWITSRSTLEYWLAGTCFILLALIVVLLIALARDTAPLEAEWGNWAEWAGVVVTSFGFVGAIITVYMQGRSVRIQEEQHLDSKREKETEAKVVKKAEAAKAVAAERAQAEHAKDEREKWARAVDFKTVAKHWRKLRGQTDHAHDGKLMLQCRAKVQGGRYTDASLIVPPLNGFEVRAERLKAAKFGANSSTSELEWRVLGDGWFGGDDDKALEWLRKHGAVEFTDSNGIRWRKDWQGSLLDITKESSEATDY